METGKWFRIAHLRLELRRNVDQTLGVDLSEVMALASCRTKLYSIGLSTRALNN